MSLLAFLISCAGSVGDPGSRAIPAVTSPTGSASSSSLDTGSEGSGSELEDSGVLSSLGGGSSPGSIAGDSGGIPSSDTCGLPYEPPAVRAAVSGDVLQGTHRDRFCVDPTSGVVSGWTSLTWSLSTGEVACHYGWPIASSSPSSHVSSTSSSYDVAVDLTYDPPVILDGDCSSFGIGDASSDSWAFRLGTSSTGVYRYQSGSGWLLAWDPYMGTSLSMSQEGDLWDVSVDRPGNSFEIP